MVRSRWSRLAALGFICTASHFSFENSVCGFADWTRFRGPNGSGVAEDKEPTPTTWSENENLKWKVPLPGAGVSCPIVVGTQVFVTCYSGYGINVEEPGDVKNLVRHLVCVDRGTGKILWQKELPSTVPEDPYSGMGVPQHGYASHTPTSDGKSVFVFFGKSGVLAFDLEGKKLWETSVGTGSDSRRWGSSSSPIVHEEVLIVPAGPEGRALIGLDKKTGKELWKLDSEKLGNVWGTPAIAKVGSSTELVIGAPGEIWGLDPKSGKFGWYCTYLDNGDQFSSSVVVDGDVIYAVEGRGGGSVAVKAGGKDDVTETKTVWKGRDSGRFASPIIYEGRLYNVSGRTLTCIDAKTQEKIFAGRMKGMNGEEAPEQGGFGGGGAGFGGGRPGAPGTPGANGQGPRSGAGPGGAGGGGGSSPGAGGPPGGGRPGAGFLSGAGGPPGGGRGGRGGGGGFGGTDYGSPVIADGKLYFTARNGETYVLSAGKEFNQLAVNRLTTDTEEFSGTPAISNGEIFIRSNKNLYCVSTKK